MTNLNPQVFYFIRKQCSCEWKLAEETIDFCDLTFILSGSAEYCRGNEVYRVEAGQAVFLPRHSVRRARTHGMECAAFSFRAEGEVPLNAGVFQWNGDELLLHYFSEFERSWFSMEKNKDLFCKGLFFLILHRLMELSEQPRINPNVLKIRKYLEAHYTEKITVAEVAKLVGLHPTYCGALFRRETGRSILQAVNVLRINRAIELFKYGTTKITDVAEQCGFSDVFYFSRVFKAVTGLAPENYLKQMTV